jgi:hypothetical protein
MPITKDCVCPCQRRVHQIPRCRGMLTIQSKTSISEAQVVIKEDVFPCSPGLGGLQPGNILIENGGQKVASFRVMSLP